MGFQLYIGRRTLSCESTNKIRIYIMSTLCVFAINGLWLYTFNSAPVCANTLRMWMQIEHVWYALSSLLHSIWHLRSAFSISRFGVMNKIYTRCFECIAFFLTISTKVRTRTRTRIHMCQYLFCSLDSKRSRIYIFKWWIPCTARIFTNAFALHLINV